MLEFEIIYVSQGRLFVLQAQALGQGPAQLLGNIWLEPLGPLFTGGLLLFALGLVALLCTLALRRLHQRLAIELALELELLIL